MGNFLSLPILALAAALQASVMPQISILGGQPDLVFLLVISWALNTPLEQGITWAFVGGILKDLLSAAPLGTSTFGLVIIVFGIHTMRQQLYSVGIFTLIWVTVLGTFFQQITVMLLLTVIGGFPPAAAGFNALFQTITIIILPAVFYNLILILPIYAFIRRIQRRLERRSRFLL
ncbi:MAG: rod shape-determining protein MreD [Anaerolineae bacterium]|nr:rod shape-determining protein MreD [Anaerolineae bacterium]